MISVEGLLKRPGKYVISLGRPRWCMNVPSNSPNVEQPYVLYREIREKEDLKFIMIMLEVCDDSHLPSNRDLDFCNIQTNCHGQSIVSLALKTQESTGVRVPPQYHQETFHNHQQPTKRPSQVSVQLVQEVWT